MAASRRLQGEIDRCLKKVAEGVEQFEDIWKKVHNANNTNQKEKYEADLKKEIKKLQRLRDQIKSWLTSAEIKDKTQLLENRKLIETQMERFKVVERETKTKAYSKEGLGAAQNKDPAQREKEELNRWLNESIDSLTMQVDQFECEIEALLAGGKKKKMDKDKSDRIEELKEWLERHRFNIKKLEILMRMLNNESIDCDNLRKIKDDVDYYVESNQDPDFMENEGLYDDIEMEDLDYPATDLPGVLGGVGDSTETSTPSPSVCGSSPAPSPASSHTTASSVSSNNNNNNNNNATMTAAVAVVAAAAAAASSSSSSQVASTNSTPGSGSSSTSSSSSSNSSTNNGTSAVAAVAVPTVNASASSSVSASNASSASSAAATTTTTTTTTSLQQSSTPTAASVVLNNHSNSSSSNSNSGGGSSSEQQQQQQQQHHHNNADGATTNNCNSTNNAGSGGAGTPSTNHNNSTHHTVERSNKRNTKDESRTPVKPTVVRPNAVVNAIITKGAHTPTKPVQGSTSVSTPNNSSTSSGMSYLAASQHNAKNSSAKSKEDHNSHINQNSTPAIINHVASQQQQQQQAAAAAVAAAAAAAQQQLAAQQQQLQQQQAQQQQQQSISSATPNGPLLHAASHHPHLHNKVLNSTDSVASSLKNIAQKKLNEVSHRTSPAAMAVAAAAAAVSASGAGSAALAAAGSSGPPSSGVPAASTASAAAAAAAAAAVSTSSLPPAVSTTTAVSSSVTGVALTTSAPPAPMGEAHIPQLLGVAPLGMTPLTPDNELQFKRLQAAYYHMPHPADNERLRIHFPRQPVTTPPHFPQVPPPLSDTVDFFQRLSTETLFFIFYYLEGTKAQYLAAKALKKQSWRFHTKYMMWFQRHEEPKAITDEFEQGTYIFFDYDNWGQRKKENFTFEYRYLEDRDLN